MKIIGSNSANFCTAFVGKVFSISGRDPVFPAVSTLPRGGPPFHPRCSKRYTAFIKALASPSDLEEARLSDDERALLNQNSTAAQRTFDAQRKQSAPAIKTPVERAAEVRQKAETARQSLAQIDAGTRATFDRLDRDRAKESSLFDQAERRGDLEAMEAASEELSAVFGQIADVHAQRQLSALNDQFL